MKRNPFRRWTDKIRLLADEVHTLGHKDISDDLHSVARKAESKRKVTK